MNLKNKNQLLKNNKLISLTLGICLLAFSAQAESPFKKAAPIVADEKILDLKPLEQTNPKKLEAIPEEKPQTFSRSPKQTKGESGLPIPRFVSLKSGEVNGRSGPGENYPIKWVYQRKNLPVEITAEFKLWRRIRDIDGDQTWVHQAMLKGERYAIFAQDAEVFTDKEQSNLMARFKRNVQVKLDECTANLCEVEYGNIKGWTQKSAVWGIYDEEKLDQALILYILPS